MTCTERPTLPTNAQTREVINIPNSPTHKLTNQHARQLINLSTHQPETLSTFQRKF